MNTVSKCVCAVSMLATIGTAGAACDCPPGQCCVNNACVSQVFCAQSPPEASSSVAAEKRLNSNKSKTAEAPKAETAADNTKSKAAKAPKAETASDNTGKAADALK